MKKYRILVYDARDLENVFDEYTNEIGQALILAKTQGHELYDVLKTKERYLFHISNHSRNIEEGEIDTIYGSYTTIGNCEITEIITKK